MTLQTMSTTRYISLSAACCMFIAAINANGGSSGESPSTPPIEIIYGYRFYDSDMRDHLEEHLKPEYNVIINFSRDLRPANLGSSPNDWFADPQQVALLSASNDCSVHAISIPSASTSWIALYRGRSRFFPIPSDTLQEYAPKYYKNIMEDRGGDRLHRPSSGDPWYALTGYRYMYEASEFLVAGRYPYEGDSDHIDIADFESLVTNARNEQNTPPFLAWRNIEYSFAPLYSAFGISTVGPSLTSISADGVPNIEGVPVHIHQNFRDFLILMRRWYQEGLINDDFVDLSYDDAVAYAHSNSFYFFSTPYGPTQIAPDRMYRRFAENDPVTLFQVTGDEQQRSWLRSPFDGAEAYMGCVTDAVIAPLLEIFEYTRFPDMSEDSGWMRRVFGIRDQHYGIGFDGDLDPYKVRNIDPRLPGPRNDDDPAMWHFKRFPEIVHDLKGEDTLAYGFPRIDELRPGLVGPGFQPPHELQGLTELDGLEAMLRQLSDLTVTSVYEFVVGKRDLSDWDAYVTEWSKSAAGEAILDALGG